MLRKKNKNFKEAQIKREKFPVTDIQIPIKKQVVNKVLGIRKYRTIQGKFLALGWRFIFACLFVVYIFTGVTPFDILERTIGAIESTETINLYAGSCGVNNASGGWGSHLNIKGEANSGPNSKIDDFNDNNSATYKGGESDLFCGEFGSEIKVRRAGKKPETKVESSGVKGDKDQENKEEIEVNKNKQERADVVDDNSTIKNKQELLELSTDTQDNNQKDEENEKEIEKFGNLEIEEDSQELLISPIDIQDTNQVEKEAVDDEIGEDSEENDGALEKNIDEKNIENEVKDGEDAISNQDSGDGLISKTWKFLSRSVNSMTASAEEFVEEYITDIHNLGEFREAKINFSFAGKKVVSEIENYKAESDKEKEGQRSIINNESESDNLEEFDEKEDNGYVDNDESVIVEDVEVGGEESFLEENLVPEGSDNQEINNQEGVVESAETDKVIEEGVQDDLLEDEEVNVNDDDNTTDSEESGDVSLIEGLFNNIFGVEKAVAEDLEMQDAKIVIWYSLAKFDFDSEERMWKRLDVISEDNISNYTNGDYFSYLAPFLESWDDVADLQIKFEGVVNDELSYEAYLDSVWVEANYKTETEIEKIEKRGRWEDALEFLSENSVLKITDTGELKFKYNKKQVKKFNGVVKYFSNKSFWDEVGLEVRLENKNGEILDIPLDIIFEENGEFTIKLPVDSPEVGPGKYKLVFNIIDESGDEVEILKLEQEFSWGVLAMNFDKSLYLPYEIGYLQMAVLDDNGHSVCNAELDMRVMTPRGVERIVSTENNRIIENPECGPNNVIDSPDFYVYYDFDELGEYVFTLTATTTNGAKIITETIKVVESVPYVVERTGPTRIYPRADYDMAIQITAEEDFSGTIVEYLPAEFKIKEKSFKYYDKLLEYYVDYKLSDDFYFDIVKNNGRQEIRLQNVVLAKGDIVEFRYKMDAPDISPEFYLLGPLEMNNNSPFEGGGAAAEGAVTPIERYNPHPVGHPLQRGNEETNASDEFLVFAEDRQWQIASDANVYRITEYYLTTGAFTGTTYDLTLTQDLANDYFVMVRGSKDGDAGSDPDNDYARVYRVPGGRGDLADSGSTNVVSLSRHVADFNWEGVVTVVECLGDSDLSGFRLLDVVETSIVGTATQGSSSLTGGRQWSDINQIVPFGGYHAGGAEFEANAANSVDGDVVATRLWPTGTSTLNWQRTDNGNGALLSSTFTTFVIDWGSNWNVQHAVVSGTNGGDGANATGEYNTATISQVARDNTWVWGTGMSAGAGTGEGAEGALVTLGNGVVQNANESTVAVGSEYTFQKDFDVYTMTHGSLATDYRFKIDGDKAVVDFAVTIDSATAGQRMSLVYNGCDAKGLSTGHPRSTFWSRYTADTTVTISRGYSGQNFPAWVEGIDFSSVQYTPPVPSTEQMHFRWRDDSVALTSDTSWLAVEDGNTLSSTTEKYNPYRLRMQVANTDLGVEVASRQYELQWGEKDTTCDNITTWTGAGNALDDFDMKNSDFINNGESITSAFLSNAGGYSFVNGLAQDTGDTTASYGPIASSTYMEFEYSIQVGMDAIPGRTYCFRLYDQAGATGLDVYNVYPELTLEYANTDTVMEWGVEASVGDDAWTLITFENTYTSPVFVCTPEYGNNIGNEGDSDADSIVCRVRNLVSTSTEVRLQEPGQVSNSLSQDEDVHWMVAEAGNYNDGNLKMEAFSYTSTVTDYKGSWTGQSQSYTESYTVPVVFGQVMTYNDTGWSAFWARGASATVPPDTSNLFTGKHVGEDTDTTRINETIGVIVIEKTNGALSGIDFEVYTTTTATIDRIDDSTSESYTFEQPFSQIPQVAILSQAGMIDNDGSSAALYGTGPLTNSGINLTVMEDEILDSEMSGADEIVSYTVFESAGVYRNGLAIDMVSYRFYDNNDSTEPVTPLTVENYPIINIDTNDVMRIRFSIQNGFADLSASSQAFKLQYAEGSDCASLTTWIDVDGIGGSKIWRGYNNTPADGATITSSLLNRQANIYGSYVEENNSPLNPNALTLGDMGEWDFVVQNNGASFGSDYCFRMVTAEGSALNYLGYPKVTAQTVEVSGFVYSDEGTTKLLTSPTVSLAIDGVWQDSVVASAVDGSYFFPTIGGLKASSSMVLYLDDSSELGTTINFYDALGDITGFNIYQNRIIIRSDYGGVVRDSQLNVYDSDEDTDIKFSANPLSVQAGNEILVLSANEFLIENNVTLDDVSVRGTLSASSTEIISVNGDWDFLGGAFNKATSTVNFTSNSSGNTILVDNNDFYNLTFSGSGDWTLADNATTTASTNISSGTFIQGSNIFYTTRNLSISSGANLTKDSGVGLLIFAGETDGSITDQNVIKTNLGNIRIGYLVSATTLASDISADSVSVSTNGVFKTDGYDITISDDLNVFGILSCSDTGEGDGTEIDLSGDWNVDSSAQLIPGTSNVIFSGSVENTINSGGVDTDHSFNDLTIRKINSTSTISSYAINILNDLHIDATAIFDVSNNNYAIDVAGEYINRGSFVARTGLITFDAGATGNRIDAGDSSFYNVDFNNVVGGWIVWNDATSTGYWHISNATAFVASSSAVIEVQGEFFNTADDSDTTWNQATLYLNGYSGVINSKSVGDTYYNIQISTSTHVSMWNSTSTIYTLDSSASLYSMDHNSANGELYIWGDYKNTGGTDYWSYATDFDGASLSGGSERQCAVYIDGNASTTFATDSTLNMVGGTTLPTLVDSQGSGNYSLKIDKGTINANYYQIRGINATGLELHGSTTVTSLNNGNFLLEIEGATMMEVDYETITTNPYITLANLNFSIAGGISTGYNMSLVGYTAAFWDITPTTGTYDGEAFDNDGGSLCGSFRWVDSDCSDLHQFNYRWRNDDNGETTATWKANEDTDIAGQKRLENVRVRYNIDNQGGPTGAYNYSIEYAELGLSASCLVVSSLNFFPVPTIVTGGEHVVMTDSTFVTNTTLTTEQLSSIGSFRNGFMVEAPNNSSGAITLPTAKTTEIEFNFQFTADAVRNNSYCFRINGNGGELASYIKIPMVRIEGVNIAGNVYEDDGSSAWSGCDGTTPNLNLVIDGTFASTTHCTAGTGVYNFYNAYLEANDMISVFLNTTGGNTDQGVTVSKVQDASKDIGLDVVKSEVILRAEAGIPALSNTDLAHCDSDNVVACSNVPYNSAGSIRFESGSGLRIASTTYIPGGDIILATSTDDSLLSGDLVIDSVGALGIENNNIVVGGSWLNSGIFSYGSDSLLYFIATSSGHIIKSGSFAFDNITFNGNGGAWSFSENTTIDGDMLILSGIATGTVNVLVAGGDVWGDGDLDFSAGTFTVDNNGNFGGATDWDFANLEFGDGVWSRASNKIGTNAINVSGVLSINTSQVLNAGTSTWVLAGGGTPFVVNGVFNSASSTFKYSGTTATNIVVETYAKLELAPGGGSPTYTVLAGNLNTTDYLNVGDGTNAVTVDPNTNLANIDTASSVRIFKEGAMTAPLGTFNVGGSWINEGTYSHDDKTVVFDSSHGGNIIKASSSPFYNIDFNNSAGSWEIQGTTTVSNHLSLLAANSFTVESNNYTIEIGGLLNRQIDGSKTDWGDSILYFNGTSQILNTKASSGDDFSTIKTGVNINIDMWNSSLAIADTSDGTYIYSMDNSATDGQLYVWGDYTRNSGVEYWAYGTDFDGADLSGGSERRCLVNIGTSSSIIIDSSELQMKGVSGYVTQVDNQGSGNYSLSIDGGTMNSEYYSIKNADSRGLDIGTSSAITTMDYGSFELGLDSGTMISIDSTTLDNNPIEIISNCDFSLKSGVSTGYNINFNGTGNTAWIITAHTGDYDGEAYDNDSGDPRGYIIWDDSPDYSPKSQNWIWYYDIDNETPVATSSSENTAPIFALNTKAKLRIAVAEVEGLSAENVKMKLQYSLYSDFSQDVFDVGEVDDNSAVWKFVDGVDVDDDSITTRVLSDSTVNGTHNESNTSTSTFDHTTGDIVEWEFTIHNNNALVGNTYYFRLNSSFYSVYDTFEKIVTINTGEAYPSVTVTSGDLTFSLASLTSGASTEGVVLNIDSTPSNIDFGSLLPNNDKIGAHRFNINTNAYLGYQLFVYKKQDFLSSAGNNINNFPATNNTPSGWPVNPNAFGYHTGDDTLSGGNPSRFAANNSYAGFNNAIEEISYSAIPVENEVVDFVYRIEIDETQAAGSYETEIVYILVPTF